MNHSQNDYSWQAQPTFEAAEVFDGGADVMSLL